MSCNEYLTNRFLNVHRASLPVSYQAPIFHGTSGEVGQRDHIHLRQRELDLEVVLVISEDSGTDVQTVSRLVDGIVAGPDSEITIVRFSYVKVGDDEGHQVRGHWYRALVMVPHICVQSGTAYRKSVELKA